MFDQLSKKEQLIFLSGVFEGEGWFGLNKRPNGWTPSACLEVQMSDEGVVHLFQNYLGLDNNIRKRKKKVHEHHKDIWRFGVKGYRALQFMEEMLPYLCTRRKEQYYAVVKAIGDGPKNWSPPVSEPSKDKTSDVGCATNACREDGAR
jgi:hypothetical protein